MLLSGFSAGIVLFAPTRTGVSGDELPTGKDVFGVAVMVVVGIVTSLFGLGRYTGTNTGQLMIFSLIVGFTGAIISLLLS